MKLKISEKEHKSRIERVRSALEEHNLDLLLVQDSSRIFYLSGFPYIEAGRPFILGIPRDREPFFIVPLLEYDHIKLFRKHWIEDVETYWEYPHGDIPAAKRIAEILEEKGYSDKRIGVDRFNLVSISNVDDVSLKEILPNAKLVQAKKIVDSMRLIKSKEEVELIEEAAKWSNLAHTYLQELIVPGVSEMEISSEATFLATREMLRTLGPEYEPYGLLWYSCWARFKAGPRTSLTHGLLANRRVRVGDVIETAAEGRIGGYTNHLERTMFVGRPSEKLERYFDLMMKAREAGLSMCKPGVRACDVHMAIVRKIKEEGYDPQQLLRHRSGHGIGLDHFEPPFLVDGDTTVLEPGMVFTFEPGIYLPKVACFRHCDTVVITEDGYEILDYYPTDIEYLTIEV
ncbi:MAG: aminopeptidase P family protein [Candidatus Korarchaeota archaeon]|nr:aminopeptidase P family protein [Candidatus Korarchaeota archaeon]